MALSVRFALGEHLQISRSNAAIGNNGLKVLFHLADDVDGEEQFFTAERVQNVRPSPCVEIGGFQICERLGQKIVLGQTAVIAVTIP